MLSKYEWDSAKAHLNVRRHRVTFEEAMEALSDTDSIVVYDWAHSQFEDRFRWIGWSSKRILLVVFTDFPGESIYRIISARPANRAERKAYDEKNKKN
jgi:uncharacterized protein